MKKGVVVACTVLLLLPMTGVSLVWAETLFIVDRVVVSLRKQPIDNAEILGYLQTDQAVKLLEVAGDYAKVRTDQGETGFVQRQYLTANEPKVAIISRLESERAQRLERLQELESRVNRSDSESGKALQEANRQLRSVQQELAGVKESLSKREGELRKLTRDYQTLKEGSGNVTQLLAERDRLLKEKQELTEKSAVFEAERDALLKKGSIKWFLAGAGVLLVGWIVGKASGTRRRSSLM